MGLLLWLTMIICKIGHQFLLIVWQGTIYVDKCSLFWYWRLLELVCSGHFVSHHRVEMILKRMTTFWILKDVVLVSSKLFRQYTCNWYIIQIMLPFTLVKWPSEAYVNFSFQCEFINISRWKLSNGLIHVCMKVLS